MLGKDEQRVVAGRKLPHEPCAGWQRSGRTLSREQGVRVAQPRHRASWPDLQAQLAAQTRRGSRSPVLFRYSSTSASLPVPAEEEEQRDGLLWLVSAAAWTRDSFQLIQGLTKVEEDGPSRLVELVAREVALPPVARLVPAAGAQRGQGAGREQGWGACGSHRPPVGWRCLARPALVAHAHVKWSRRVSRHLRRLVVAAGDDGQAGRQGLMRLSPTGNQAAA